MDYEIFVSWDLMLENVTKLRPISAQEKSRSSTKLWNANPSGGGYAPWHISMLPMAPTASGHLLRGLGNGVHDSCRFFPNTFISVLLLLACGVSQTLT